MTTRTLTAVVALLIFAGPFTARAQMVTGQAHVIDGETIEIDGQRIRLFGIEAPEIGQQCGDNSGRMYPCGADAAEFLVMIVGLDTPVCIIIGIDPIVAKCTAGNLDLGRWMVENGHAISESRFFGLYAAEERSARKSRVGMWGIGTPADVRTHRQMMRRNGERP